VNSEAIRIVLVNTTHPGNIGGVARAMKNMGLDRLVLVAPRKFPHEEADWRAAGAQDVLQNAVVVDSLAAAIADCQLVVGTSARGRRIPWPLLDPGNCAREVQSATGRGEEVAVVFGREDRGLTNEELQVCNLHLHVPTHEDYPSLNLAMAVQIVAYELRMRALDDEIPEDPTDEWDAPFSTAENMERFYQHLEETLVQIGFLDPAAPRQLMTRLRRLYGRVRLDEMELNILRGILTETQRAAGTNKPI
jgi:tRNA (cytidine32/uridine32-2'-O)-methyltransferase